MSAEVRLIGLVIGSKARHARLPARWARLTNWLRQPLMPASGGLVGNGWFGRVMNWSLGWVFVSAPKDRLPANPR